jgi:two-component system, chemotaxis family, chemotaxis protein CheY
MIERNLYIRSTKMNTIESPKTILLVDDDIDLLTQTEINLKNEGFNVIACNGQDTAEVAFKKNKIDLVVTDLMMESFDGGFSLTQYIKGKQPNMPIIVVTGVTTETGLEFSDVVEEESDLPKADAVLYKPVKFPKLMEEIKKYI